MTKQDPGAKSGNRGADAAAEFKFACSPSEFQRSNPITAQEPYKTQLRVSGRDPCFKVGTPINLQSAIEFFLQHCEVWGFAELRPGPGPKTNREHRKMPDFF